MSKDLFSPKTRQSLFLVLLILIGILGWRVYDILHTPVPADTHKTAAVS